MKKLILLIALIALGHSQDTYSCTNTNAIKKQICESIKINEKNACAYSGSSCTEGYTKCEDYKPASDFTDSKCTSINPSDSNYKCKVQGEGNAKSCVTELKECSEYATANNCIDLKAGDGQRCVLYNGNCEAHKDECNGLTQNKCENNIPKLNTKKCKWSSNSCTSVDRLCEDLISYSDKYGGSDIETCPNLKIDSSTLSSSMYTCGYIGGCTAYPKSCEVGNDNKAVCESITPLNDQRTAVDELSKCTYSGTKCSKEEKKCLEFANSINDPLNCGLLKTSNGNKMCMSGFSINSYLHFCKEEYITCDSYNKDITDKKQRDSNTCSSITPKDPKTKVPDYHSECYLDSDSNCVIRKKECSQLSPSICNEHTFDDSSKSNKRCLYTDDDGCKEIYKKCSDYNTLEEAQRNKKDCEIIESTEESNPFLFKCVFDSNKKECTKEKKDCSDYKGYDSDECTLLTTNLDNKHKCVMINSVCTKQEKTCTDYEGSTKADCEAIINEKINYKCVFNSENHCVEEQRPCDDYSGWIESECASFKPSVSGNRCSIGLNDKCQEIYNDCEKYTEGDTTKCTNIQRNDITYKCVFDGTCKNEKKVCSDAKYETECNAITPTDTNKQCAFINNYECVEQYKTCELYQSKESSKNQNGCESIILKSNTIKKCQYINSECTTTDKGCKDLFAPTQTLNECSTLTYNSNKEKCIFDSSNLSCSIKDKNCLEMTYLTGATEDDCKNAATSSSNKVCSVKADKTGCEEVEKQNSATINNLSKIIIISLALLF